MVRKPTDLDYDEIEVIKENCCEACKGVWWMQDSRCYETCEGFAEELKEWEENE